MEAAADGEERVLATAQHILRSLGTDVSMTDDMLRILSKFDNRFSSMNDRSSPKSKQDAAAPTTSHDGAGGGREDIPAADKEAEDGREEEGALETERESPDLDALEKVLLQWDISSSDAARHCMIWDLSRQESGKYLEAVDEVRSVLNSVTHSPDLHNHAQSLEEHAMSRLEEEFRHMLRAHSEPLDPDWLIETIQGGGSLNSSVEETEEASRAEDGENEEEDVPVARPVSDLQMDLLPPEVTADLSDIARRMILAGYEADCCQLYGRVRKAVLEESLAGLSVERYSSNDEIQKMDWDVLEGRILKWIQAIKVAVKILFASERRLCEQVFGDFETMQENCFAVVSKSAMMQLLGFSEAISVSKRKPEKLFKVLDMYEVLRDLLPEIEATFTGEECTPVRTKADEILTRLGDAARGTFAEFEDLIQNDTSKSPVPGGAVHPLTRYVMNYIRFLFEYTETLKQLFGIKKKDEPKLSRIESNGPDRDGRMKVHEKSPLAVQTIYITEVLERNLDTKSKAYKDIALTYLFLMNNVHYIAQKVKTTEVRSLLGDDWVRRHSSMVRQHATSYQRASWNKVLQCLRDEGIHTTGSAASSVSRVVLKDRFKSFNLAFEEVHKAQSGWIVPDPQLRDELRVAIAEKLLPAYRSFLGRYRWYLESGKRLDKYIKYSSDDLENHLNDLFEGSSGSMTLRRRSFAPP